MSLKSSCDKILEHSNLAAYGNLACRRLIRFSEFPYQFDTETSIHQLKQLVKRLEAEIKPGDELCSRCG